MGHFQAEIGILACVDIFLPLNAWLPIDCINIRTNIIMLL